MLGLRFKRQIERRDGYVFVGYLSAFQARPFLVIHLMGKPAGVELDERGFVKTDHQLRTTQAGIFAIGDIAGPPMLAHTASHQGRIVVEAIHGKDIVYEPSASSSLQCWVRTALAGDL